MKARQAVRLESIPDARPVASRLYGRRLVKQHFQHKFSFIIFSLFLVIVFVNWGVGKYVINQMFELGLIDSTQSLVHFHTLNEVIVKSSCLGLILLYGAVLFFSHYIAGPIYRLERVFEQMAEGDIGMKVNLRKYDEFKEVAALLNGALAGLRERLADDQKDLSNNLHKISSLVASLRGKGRSKEADQLEKIYLDLKHRPSRIQF
jgi:methyl-accepting chemotaxis protein